MKNILALLAMLVVASLSHAGAKVDVSVCSWEAGGCGTGPGVCDWEAGGCGAGSGGGAAGPYVLGTVYVNDNLFWGWGGTEYCLKAGRFNTNIVSGCALVDEVGLPFKSDSGLKIVSLTCVTDPSGWTTAGQWIDLEVAVHEVGDPDEFGTDSNVVTRIVAQAGSETVAIATDGDATHTSSITEGWVTVRAILPDNWTTGAVQTVCSVTVQ